MQDLTPVGLSEDGRQLLLVSSVGEEFAVPVDTRLRAALRGENPRPGQLEMKMESSLRPRDIQARIRAGESPDEVAAAAQTTVEAIMGFATPVLAERAHVAQTARRASVRRRSGDSSSAGDTLGEAAELFFADHSLHDEDVEWDAWRRPDGRWALVATYAVQGQPRTAEFGHDLPGRYVVAENDEARILTGELPEPQSRRPAGGRTSTARRLSSVPSQGELPLGDDAIELVRDRDTTAEEPAGPDEQVESGELTGQAEVEGEVALPLEPDPEPAHESVHEPVDAPADQPTAETANETASEPPAGAAPKKKSRSSVPSWDEIMFGGKSE